MEQKSQSVQFMQFDKEGNLFVFEPGAGCSGIARKIPQGFSQEDLEFTNEDLYASSTQPFEPKCEIVEESKSNFLLKVHKLVPQSGMSSLRLRSRFVPVSYIS